MQRQSQATNDEPSPMTGGMPTTPAVYPESLCEQYARRVYVHLRAGRWRHAEAVIASASVEIPRLCGQCVDDPGSIHIKDLAGVPTLTATALENGFGVSFVRDLEGISPDMIRKRTHVSDRSIALLIDACGRVGFPWPANGE